MAGARGGDDEGGRHGDWRPERRGGTLHERKSKRAIIGHEDQGRPGDGPRLGSRKECEQRRRGDGGDVDRDADVRAATPSSPACRPLVPHVAPYFAAALRYAVLRTRCCGGPPLETGGGPSFSAALRQAVELLPCCVGLPRLLRELLHLRATEACSPCYAAFLRACACASSVRPTTSFCSPIRLRLCLPLYTAPAARKAPRASSTVMPPKLAPGANRSGSKKRDNAVDSGNGPIRSAKSRRIDCRCSPHLLSQIMTLIVENDEQKGYVGEIGFGSFLSMGECEMDKALTLWLVDKFDCDSESLEFEGGISIPVRPLVKSVLGIPSGPIEVEEDLDVDDTLYYQYTCNRRAKNAMEVANEMCIITDKEPFCIAFMMAILGIYLAPNTSGAVNRALLGAIKQVDKLKEMDWCNFVATYLFEGIKEFKESNTTCLTITGCVHILSVIFIDFVKNAAFEVPVGFSRLGVVTTKHIEWVVQHPFTSLMVRRPEESIYAAVLDNLPKDNIVEDGKYVDSETNTDALSDKFGTTDSNQNNRHPTSAELDTAITSPNTTSCAIPEHVELGTSLLSAATSGEQLQSSRPSSEPCSAQMHAAPYDPKGMNRRSKSPMENAGGRSAKKARVDRPSSDKAKRGRGVAAVDLSALNCTLCSRPLKRPVFQCIDRHLACGRCLTERPGEQCQMCEHGGGFSPCPIMDNIVSLAMVECSHDGCKSSLPYHELDDHESTCPHAPCYCTEPGCGFVGLPQVLLSHLAALHSVPVHTVNYGKVHRLRVSEPRFLLHGEGDDSVFLLAVGSLGGAIVVSVVCISAGVSPQPRYAVKLWANGPPVPSSAAGKIEWELEAVTSSTRPGEVVVEELPSFMMVPPAYLVGSGASKAVTLDIRIDKM